jgi:hypothetical protein
MGTERLDDRCPRRPSLDVIRATHHPPPQAIYEFNGSDARYLSAAHNVWPGAGERPWSTLSLRTSYRITGPMATFINEVR